MTLPSKQFPEEQKGVDKGKTLLEIYMDRLLTFLAGRGDQKKDSVTRRREVG